MHLFSRVAQIHGGPRRSLDWATRITEKVNQLMDVDVVLWNGTLGHPGPTVAWSAVVESRAHLEAQMAKAAVDDGFLDLAEEGAEFTGGTFQDTLRSFVHMTSEPTGDLPSLGAWAELVTAAPAEGQLAAAMAWGVEIADRYKQVTGAEVAFMSDDYGLFGQVTWASIHESAEAADAANAALAADADIEAALDGAGGLFLAGSGIRSAVSRVA